MNQILLTFYLEINLSYLSSSKSFRVFYLATVVDLLHLYVTPNITIFTLKNYCLSFSSHACVPHFCLPITPANSLWQARTEPEPGSETNFLITPLI